MRKILFGALGSIFLLSCGDIPQNESHSQQKKEWNSAHNPFIMDSALTKELKYKVKYSELPLSGQLKKRPWTDSYWPSYLGGLSYRWNDDNSSDERRSKYSLVDKSRLSSFNLSILSPTEKFDIFLGNFNYPFTKQERMRTEILKPGANIPDWEGLCDPWSAAALFFKEPGPVTLKGRTGIMVPFGSSDVKGLLVHFLRDAPAANRFLGTRCEVDVNALLKQLNRGVISRSYYLQQIEECSGVNAGSFHIVLANQIGLLNEGFIFDRDPGPEVWNQPLWGYTSKVISDKKTKSANAAPNTVREIELRTQVRYIEEIDETWDLPTLTGEASLDYHYRIELDAKGSIIGGEWISEMRPDFAWKQELPAFRGKDFEAIKEIYEAAIGQPVPKPTAPPPQVKPQARRQPEHGFMARMRRR